MSKILSRENISHYNNKGFLYPLRVISAKEAQATRQKFETLEEKLGGKFSGIHRTKFYLRYRWALRLATTPRLLDIVEDLIGPNILLYHNTTWFKNPADQGYVTWHQDITYFGHEPPDVLSVWIALTPTNQESGCMQVLPGTHKEGPLPLTTPDLSKNNMLPSGQLVEFDTSSVAPVSMPLEEGEGSIHHACTIHGSPPNRSNHRRMGITFCYHSPNVKQRGSQRTSALLVRGQDDWGHYELEKPPETDDHPDAITRHEHAVSLYRGKEAELGKRTGTRFD